MSKEVLFDFDRRNRLGVDEAVLCKGKSVRQLAQIVELARKNDKGLLLTQLPESLVADLPARIRDSIEYDSVSKTAFFNHSVNNVTDINVAIVTAGTSDVSVALEAERTFLYHGWKPTKIFDVGVAGLWRLGKYIGQLEHFAIVIVVAGMDGALPSVIGGLLGGLVIAVPTSSGYGASENGRTAMMAALTSCAPGIVVVNIDNGYGAAVAAIRAHLSISTKD